MNQPTLPPHQYVGVGGDFGRVFDPEDYLTMVNALDEATVVLRIHLVLEEFLNIWSSRVTRTDDLFEGTFVPFKTKLTICQNLGLDGAFAAVIDKVNDIRNRYTHRRKYKIEENALLSLRDKITALPSEQELLPCEKFEIYLDGVDQTGQRKQISYSWQTADTKKRLAIIQIILVLKLVQWMQKEFNARGIAYNLVVFPASLPPSAGGA
jgi:hypothetical protein